MPHRIWGLEGSTASYKVPGNKYFAFLEITNGEIIL
jgi:hypothetical protein